MSLTSDAWFHTESKQQLDYFEKTKKAKRASNPQHADFISNDEFEQALENRVRLCPNEMHVGERLLKYTVDNFYKENGVPGGACKQCKKLKQLGDRKEKTVATQDAKNQRFRTAQDWEQFNKNAYSTNSKHRHVTPKENEFVTTEVYLDAVRIEQERCIAGGESRLAKKQYTDTENTKKRKQYADDRAGVLSAVQFGHDLENESGRLKLKEKQRQDQKNKMARKIKASTIGKVWCPHGSHAVDATEMTFCPKYDLGIANFPESSAGSTPRYVCKKHYVDWLMQDRKFKQKYRDDLTLRWRFRLEWWTHECRRKHKTISLTREEQLQMIRGNCYYCAAPSTDEKMNGIDMLHPLLRDYNSYTCVSCCTQCNMSKGGLKYQDYIQICRNVVEFQEEECRNQQFIPYRRCARNKATGKMKAVYYVKSMCYDKYRYEASTNRRNLEFAITAHDYDSMVSKGCAYCGLQKRLFIGLDQIDAGKGYTLANLNGACVSCNFVKRNYSMASFVEKCKEVATMHIKS